MHAGHFEIGGEHAAGIARVLAGDPPRQHLRLLVGGLEEPVAAAAMLGAFADGVNAGCAGLETVVDRDAADDASPAVRASSALARMPTATTRAWAGMLVPSVSSTASTRPSPMMRAVSASRRRDAARFDRALEQRARARVELALH